MSYQTLLDPVVVGLCREMCDGLRLGSGNLLHKIVATIARHNARLKKVGAAAFIVVIDPKFPFPILRIATFFVFEGEDYIVRRHKLVNRVVFNLEGNEFTVICSGAPVAKDEK